MREYPEPGEVWIVSEPKYGTETWHTIPYADLPFIVTYVSASFIGFVRAGAGPEPFVHQFQRGLWEWHAHCTRLWPPVPSWEELAAVGRTGT